MQLSHFLGHFSQRHPITDGLEYQCLSSPQYPPADERVSWLGRESVPQTLPSATIHSPYISLPPWRGPPPPPSSQTLSGTPQPSQQIWRGASQIPDPSPSPLRPRIKASSLAPQGLPNPALFLPVNRLITPEPSLSQMSEAEPAPIPLQLTRLYSKEDSGFILKKFVVIPGPSATRPPNARQSNSQSSDFDGPEDASSVSSARSARRQQLGYPARICPHPPDQPRRSLSRPPRSTGWEALKAQYEVLVAQGLTDGMGRIHEGPLEPDGSDEESEYAPAASERSTPP